MRLSRRANSCGVRASFNFARGRVSVVCGRENRPVIRVGQRHFARIEKKIAAARNHALRAARSRVARRRVRRVARLHFIVQRGATTSKMWGSAPRIC